MWELGWRLRVRGGVVRMARKMSHSSCESCYGVSQSRLLGEMIQVSVYTVVGSYRSLGSCEDSFQRELLGLGKGFRDRGS